MIRFSSVICLLALGISACDSEGIDRVADAVPSSDDIIQPISSLPDTATGIVEDTAGIAEIPVNTPANDATSTDAAGAPGDAPVSTGNDAPVSNEVSVPVVVPAPADDDASDTTGINVVEANVVEAEVVEANDTTGVSVADTSSTGDAGQNDQDISATSGSAQISDDAGSSTSDGGETAPVSTANDSGVSDSSAGDNAAPAPQQISDDAGSATSDGGNVAGDNAAGAVIADDAPVATNDPAPVPVPAPAPAPTVAEDFASDNVGGSVLRRSTLSASSQAEVCTAASNQDNFSDMRIGDFILHNNAWRPDRAFPGYEWEQCINSNTNGAVAGWSYDWGPGVSGLNGSPSASGDFYVRSYPELIFGVKDEFRTSAPQSVTGLPVELAQLPNITIDYSYNGPQFGNPRVVDASNNVRFPNGTTISGERNVAIESFLYNKDAAGQCSEGIVSRTGGSNHTFEIMVWLDAGAERLPAGPSDFVTDLNIRGEAFKVYTKGSDPRYIAFVAQNPQNSGTVFWNDFVDWAKDNAHQVQARFGARSNAVPIQDDWCVANILVGTEIFWGAGNFELFNWTITQSQ